MTTIVAMTGEHLPAVLAHEPEMFGTEAWSASAYREELADTRYRHYVAAVDDDGTLQGWAGVRIVGPEAEILTVGVVRSARRLGIGTVLLTDLLDEATRRRAGVVFLEVRVDNVAARALYEREGFTELGIRRGYYDGGRVDALTMSRATVLPGPFPAPGPTP